MAILTMMARVRRWKGAVGRRAAWFIGLALLGLTGPAASAQATISAEYQLKAVFLFNFAQFVEWPARAFPEPKAPLLIGILGDDPFGAYLDDLVRGEKIGDRPLLIRRGKRTEDISDCHIVFVGRSEARDLEGIVARLKERSLLTVSDTDAFTRSGGMVRFVMEGGKIRLRINADAAKACGLTISSKILRPGTIVTPGKD
jgi:hypothetical protein